MLISNKNRIFEDFNISFFIEFYIKDIQCRSTNPLAEPVILKETVSTAWVDGGSGLGADVANFCMDIAIKKAKEAGVGWVVAKRKYLQVYFSFWN